MINVSLTKKLERPEERITFSLSPVAQMILGLDDPTLVAEMCPTLVRRWKSNETICRVFTATREDVRTICYDLNERSEAGEFGFGHSPYERRCARRHAEQLFAQLFPQSK